MEMNNEPVAWMEENQKALAWVKEALINPIPLYTHSAQELNDGGEPVKNATYWKRQCNLLQSSLTNLQSSLYHANEQIKYLESHLVTTEDGCGNCHACLVNVMENNLPITFQRMILCPECGNKRCPKASNHRYQCTGSNEIGQKGSIYTHPAKTINNQKMIDVLMELAKYRLLTAYEIEELAILRKAQEK